MAHCPICYNAHFTRARSLSCKPSSCYDAEARSGKSKLNACLGVCGCDKCVWMQQHTHTLSPSSHHPAQLCDLIMPPFRSSSHSKEHVSRRERPCLFGVMLLLFFTSCGRLNIFCDCMPTLRLDTCYSNLLSFTGRAYMLSLQQMSPLGDRSLNRIFHQRQSQN